MFIQEDIMQSEGGYSYPSNKIFLALSVISICVTGVIWLIFLRLSGWQVFTLFMGLEGTSLLASAFTPVGLIPPQGKLWNKIKWFLSPQKGVMVSFDQRMFYSGLLFLFLSFTGAFIK
jgi:hypothetical protein